MRCSAVGIPIIIESPSALLGAVQDGSIRMLAVTSSEETAEFSGDYGRVRDAARISR